MSLPCWLCPSPAQSYHVHFRKTEPLLPHCPGHRAPSPGLSSFSLTKLQSRQRLVPRETHLRARSGLGLEVSGPWFLAGALDPTPNPASGARIRAGLALPPTLLTSHQLLAAECPSRCGQSMVHE